MMPHRMSHSAVSTACVTALATSRFQIAAGDDSWAMWRPRVLLPHTPFMKSTYPLWVAWLRCLLRFAAFALAMAPLPLRCPGSWLTKYPRFVNIPCSPACFIGYLILFAFLISWQCVRHLIIPVQEAVVYR